MHAHDIINNSLPLNIADLFMEIGDVHNYNTISAAGKNLYQPQTRLNLSYKPFSSIGVNVWNSLSPFIRSLSNFLFEKEWKYSLMESLLSCDDYVWLILCRHFKAVTSCILPDFLFIF